MVTPTVPDFKFLAVSLAAVLLLATAMIVVYMARKSRASFAAIEERDPSTVSLWDVIRRGRLPAGSFYFILTIQFLIAGSYVLQLDKIRYVDDNRGLAAYEKDHNTTNFDVHVALIPHCHWGDRYDEGRIDDIVAGNPPPLRDPDYTLPEDQRITEFSDFAQAVSNEFRKQGPGAIRNLTERLNPIFAIISAFFLISLRGVLKKGEKVSSYPMKSALGGVILSFCFVLLAYFVILGYHASTEVSAAYAAGRVVCVGHVKAFFEGQTLALVFSTIGLLMLFVMSPRPIFRNI